MPVVVGGITIYQGDLLHGDLNGVTTIPHEIAAESLRAAGSTSPRRNSSSSMSRVRTPRSPGSRNPAKRR